MNMLTRPKAHTPRGSRDGEIGDIEPLPVCFTIAFVSAQH
jgi:hypothetical protein